MAKLTFLGHEILSSCPNYRQTPIILSLLDLGHEIEAIIIKRKSTRSRQTIRPAIIDLAEARNLKIIEIKDKAEFAQAIAPLRSKLAILAGFGLIINPEIIRHFPLGILNCHPSLLPLYRGSTPIETAILNGDQKTGISLISLNEKLDQGDIYTQKSLHLKAEESKLELTSRLGKLSAQVLKEHLPAILNQKLLPKAQDEKRATYTEAIKASPPHDFKADSAQRWARHIRAFDGCPNNKFEILKTIVEIKEAKPINEPITKDIFFKTAEKALYVACQKNYLAIKSLQPASRRIMAAADFINGLKQAIDRV